MNLEYILGMICGILMVAAVVWLFNKLLRKCGGRIGLPCKKGSFDERQLLARGKAYQAAFFTLSGYMALAACLDQVFEISILASYGGLELGFCISLLVFAVICICKDAYMSLYENPLGVVVTFLAIGTMNLLIGIQQFHANSGKEMEEDIFFKGYLFNLDLGILVFVILIVFAGKLFYNKIYMEEKD